MRALAAAPGTASAWRDAPRPVAAGPPAARFAVRPAAAGVAVLAARRLARGAARALALADHAARRGDGGLGAPVARDVRPRGTPALTGPSLAPVARPFLTGGVLPGTAGGPGTSLTARSSGAPLRARASVTVGPPWTPWTSVVLGTPRVVGTTGTARRAAPGAAGTAPAAPGTTTTAAPGPGTAAAGPRGAAAAFSH
ncbi:hypothetical protein [Sphaerisporangium sp. NPDC051011]|uniref:hypothetical protein n=1 Tax=Sphaerisporangium sp. NPDC051011 TaxID=3155792 RepID=UPI0033F4950E